VAIVPGDGSPAATTDDGDGDDAHDEPSSGAGRVDPHATNAAISPALEAGSAAARSVHGVMPSREHMATPAPAEPAAAPAASDDTSAPTLLTRLPASLERRVSIDISHQELGAMRIEAHRNGGGVKLTIDAPGAAARAALADRSSDLLADLRRSGVPVTTLDVGGRRHTDVGSGSQHRQPLPGQSDGRSGRSTTTATATSTGTSADDRDASAAEPVALAVGGERRLDLKL
jgi:hypothetical protein